MGTAERCDENIEVFLKGLEQKIPEEKRQNKPYVVKRARQEVKMTIRELAGVLGQSIDTVSGAENGRVTMVDDYYVAVMFACCARNMVLEVGATGRCPDCGRLKARNATDAEKDRYCPRWWSTTDNTAVRDCEEYQRRMIDGE